MFYSWKCILSGNLLRSFVISFLGDLLVQKGLAKNLCLQSALLLTLWSSLIKFHSSIKKEEEVFSCLLCLIWVVFASN